MEQIHANISEGSLADKGEYRDRIDILRSRASLLSGKDKLLMTMYLENGNSFRQMARLAGVHEGTISRRIHNVARRLIGGKYMKFLRNCDKCTRSEMSVARDYFLRGLSIKRIAKKQRHSYYRVYETLKKVRRVVEEGGNEDCRLPSVERRFGNEILQPEKTSGLRMTAAGRDDKSGYNG